MPSPAHRRPPSPPAAARAAWGALRTAALAAAWCGGLRPGVAAEPLQVIETRPGAELVFETDIRPILERHCLACHSEAERQGDLVLETVAGMLAGGDSGPALVPGSPDASLLVSLAAHRAEPVMPPAGNAVAALDLDPQELGLLSAWVAAGARSAGPPAAASPTAWRPIGARFAPVSAVALSPDGQLAALARGDRLLLHTVPDGRLLADLVDPALGSAAHADLVEAIAFSRTGDRLVSGGFREAKVWRRPRDVRAWEVADAAAATALAASPDGTAIATAEAGRLRVLDAATGTARITIPIPDRSVTALAFADGGRTLLAGDSSGGVGAWSAVDGASLGAFESPQPVRALAVVGTGGLLAAAPGTDEILAVGGGDAMLRTFRLPDSLPLELLGAAEPGRRFAVSADRRMLAVVGRTGAVRILSIADPAAPRETASWTLDRGAATSVCLVEGADGLRLATGAADGSISLWNVAGGALTARLGTGSRPVAWLAASPDGTRLVSADAAGSVALWRTTGSDAPAGAAGAGALDAVTAVAFHPGRRTLAVAGLAAGVPTIVVRPLDGATPATALTGHRGAVRAIAFTPDGTRLASAADDATVRVWDPARAGGGALSTIPALPSPAAALGWSADGARIAVAGADQVLRTFNAADGAAGSEHRGHAGPILACGFTTAGQPWSASADATVRSWNPADGQQASSWQMPAAPRAAVATPDGQSLLVASADGALRFHPLSGGQPARVLSGPAVAPSMLATSADGTRLVTLEPAADRALVRHWDVAAGRHLETRECAPTSAAFADAPEALVRVGTDGSPARTALFVARHLEVPPQPVAGVASLPGGIVVIGSADGTLRGFQGESGQATFTASHGLPVTALAAAADGSLLATAAKGGGVRFWRGDGTALGQGLASLPGEVAALALAPGARRALVSLAPPPAPPGGPPAPAAILSVDPATGTLLERRAAPGAPATWISLGDGDAGVLSAGDDGARHWSLGALGSASGHGGPVTAIAAIPTAPLEVVTGCADGLVRRVRLADGQMAGQFSHGGPVTAVAVRADGQRVASAGEAGSIRLWRADGQALGEHKGDLRLLAAAAAAKREQAAAAERVVAGKARAEAAEKDAPLKTQAAATAKTALDAAEADLKQKTDAFAVADAARIAAEKDAVGASTLARTAARDKLRADRQVADAQGEAKVAEQKAALLAAAATAAPADAARTQAADAAALAVVAAQQRVQQMQTAAQAAATAATAAAAAADGATQKVAATQKPAADAAAALRGAEGARRLAAQQHEIAARESDAATRLVPASREALAAAEAGAAQATQAAEGAAAAAAAAVRPLRHLAFSADGRHLACAGDFPAAQLCDGDTGLPVASFAGQTGPLAGVAFAAGGRVVSAAADAAVGFVIDPPWELERVVGGAGADAIADRAMALDISPDGTLLLVGGGVPSRSGELAVFRIADGTRVLHLPEAHDDAVFAARFSPDGRRIASGGADKYLRTFDLADGRALRRFEGHTNYVLGLAWKTDGQTIASGGADNVVKVWDAETGDQRLSIPPFARHVTSVRYVGDSDTLLAGCGDRVVRLLNGGGGVTRAFSALDGWVHSADVSPGGDVVVAGAADGTARLWNGTTGATLADIVPDGASPPPPAAASGR